MSWIHKKEANHKFVKDIVFVAFPIAFQTLVTQVLQLTDNLMVGTLGESCIAAVSICGTFIWLSSTFVSGICGGAGVLCAQEFGRNDLKKIKRIFSLILIVNVFINFAFFFLLTFFPLEVMKIYSNISGVYQPGIEYFKYVKYSLLFSAVTSTIVSLLQSSKNVKLSLYNSILSCLSNVFINWLFIFGNWGMPRMGVAGAALGTLMARIVEFCVTVTYFFFIEKKIQFKLFDLNPVLDKKTLKTLIQVTIPIMIIDILMNLISSVQTMITGRISEYYVSANSIVHNAYMIPNVFSVGLAVAAGVMIGNKLGANEMEEVKDDTERFIFTSAFFGLVNVVFLFVLMPVVSDFYQVSGETLELAREMSYVAAIAVFFMPISYVLTSGVIKARGKTNRLLKIDVISNWAICVPAGYLAAFHLNFPPEYLYIILRFGYVIKTVWAIWQIKTGKWLE